jgi:rhomboid protease GluP
MEHDHDAAPVNPLPPAVILLALPIVLVELWLSAGAQGFVGGPGAVGWRLDALERFGFVPALFGWMMETGQWRADYLVTLVTYPFLHFSFMHMIMALVFLLALGKMVGEAMGSRAVFVIFFGASVAGALVQGLVTDGQHPLAGGFPGDYGLIGGFTFLLRAKLISEGGPAHRAFGLIAALLVIQLIFGLLFGAGTDWIAEVVGFGAGFGLSFLLVPGGWARILGRLRNR